MRIRLADYEDAEIRVVGQYLRIVRIDSRKTGRRKRALIVNVWSDDGQKLCGHVLVGNLRTFRKIKHGAIVEFKGTVRRYFKRKSYVKRMDFGIHNIHDIQVLPDDFLSLLKGKDNG